MKNGLIVVAVVGTLTALGFGTWYFVSPSKTADEKKLAAAAKPEEKTPTTPKADGKKTAKEVTVSTDAPKKDAEPVKEAPAKVDEKMPAKDAPSKETEVAKEATPPKDKGTEATADAPITKADADKRDDDLRKEFDKKLEKTKTEMKAYADQKFGVLETAIGEVRGEIKDVRKIQEATLVRVGTLETGFADLSLKQKEDRKSIGDLGEKQTAQGKEIAGLRCDLVSLETLHKKDVARLEAAIKEGQKVKIEVHHTYSPRRVITSCPRECVDEEPVYVQCRRTCKTYVRRSCGEYELPQCYCNQYPRFFGYYNTAAWGGAYFNPYCGWNAHNGYYYNYGYTYSF